MPRWMEIVNSRPMLALARGRAEVLRKAGLREAYLAGRARRQRALRMGFEALGSARFSRPALYELDTKLDAIIKMDRGFFVEAGGADGYSQSNSYYLERFRGWRGLLVEPMPEMAAEARRNRPDATVFECALVPTGYEHPSVEMEFGHLFTTVRGVHGDDQAWVAGGLSQGWRDHRVEAVPARTLTDVLEESDVDHVDLLSLDVEGYEPEVLRGLDLERIAPTWILVEMHDLEAGRAKIGPILGGRYIEYAVVSPYDVLYHRAGTRFVPQSAVASLGAIRPA